MRIFQVGLLTLFLSSELSAQAEEVVTLEDPALRWVWGATLVASLLALIISAYTIFIRRRLDATSKWLLLVGLVLLPVFVWLNTSAIVFEQSKQVAACASCHIMHPFVKDLRNSESRTLAALHYQNRWIADNQCYSCHTDYHLFGTMEAKLAGVRHLFNFYTGRYELPIKIAKPHRNSICLHCHGPSKKYQKVELHKQVGADIMANKTTCVECHSPVHPPRETRAH